MTDRIDMTEFEDNALPNRLFPIIKQMAVAINSLDGGSVTGSVPFYATEAAAISDGLTAGSWFATYLPDIARAFAVEGDNLIMTETIVGQRIIMQQVGAV
jgi:hypothetical protein